MTNGKGERELPYPTPLPITTQWRIQGRGRGDPTPLPIFLEKTEARRAEKTWPPPPPYLKVWIRHCHPTKNWKGWGQLASCIASFRAGYFTVIMNEVCCQDLSSMWKEEPETLKSKQSTQARSTFKDIPHISLSSQ